MKENEIIPKTETCNSLLSLLLKLNKIKMAWFVYEEMVKMNIKSSIVTFNIMINILCREGKWKKAKDFIGHMEVYGVKPNVVTYNTVINGYCLRGCVKKEGLKRHLVYFVNCWNLDWFLML